MEGIKNKHPEWRYIFWGDEEIDSFFKFGWMWQPEYRQFSNEEIKQWYDFYTSLTTNIAKTEFFRLVVLYVMGGMYIDLDVECVKPVSKYLFHNVKAFVAREDGVKVCNAVMGAEIGSEFIKCQIEKALTMPIDRPGWSIPLITEATNGLEPLKLVTVFPTEYFYPYCWNEEDESKMVAKPETYFIHRWAKTWWEKKPWEKK